MARPRKPTAILELNGSMKAHPERKRARANEPEPTGELGNAPSYMTAEEKKVWRELKRDVPSGVLTSAERIAVELVCRLTSRLRDGSIKPQECSVLRSTLGSLGLTAADRSKVSVKPKEKTKDEWSDFLTGENEEHATQ